MVKMSYYVIRALLVIGLVGILQACSSVPQKGPVSDAKKQSLVNTYVTTAGVYLQRGQLEYVKEKLDKAMAINPNDVNVNNVMGLYQWKIKQFDEAEKYFEKAIRINPKNPESLNNYGVFLCERGKILKSVKYFDRAIAVPVYLAKIQAYTNAGRCFLKKKNYKRAEKYFVDALTLNPYFPEALRQMAKITARNGQLVAARKFINKYFLRGKKTAETIYLALRIEETMGNKKAAILHARTLKAKFPDSQEANWVKNRSRKKR